MQIHAYTHTYIYIYIYDIHIYIYIYTLVGEQTSGFSNLAFKLSNILSHLRKDAAWISSVGLIYKLLSGKLTLSTWKIGRTPKGSRIFLVTINFQVRTVSFREGVYIYTYLYIYLLGCIYIYIYHQQFQGIYTATSNKNHQTLLASIAPVVLSWMTILTFG